MAVVHWPATIPVERRREFEDAMASFAPEYPGILNWLIEGALRFIEGGLPEPPAVADATQEYRDEMDPVGQFVRDCVAAEPGHSEGARACFDAYVSCSLANATWHVKEQRFAKAFSKHFVKEETRVRRYLDCRLHDVPDRPEMAGSPQPY
jgi:putative DNA primase/helicase